MHDDPSRRPFRERRLPFRYQASAWHRKKKRHPASRKVAYLLAYQVEDRGFEPPAQVSNRVANPRTGGAKAGHSPRGVKPTRGLKQTLELTLIWSLWSRRGRGCPRQSGRASWQWSGRSEGDVGTVPAGVPKIVVSWESEALVAVVAIMRFPARYLARGYWRHVAAPKHHTEMRLSLQVPPFYPSSPSCRLCRCSICPVGILRSRIVVQHFSATVVSNSVVQTERQMLVPD